jgi:hypothetical protein
MQARSWGGVFNTPKYVKMQETNFAGLILKY